jgi:8-oxo-dGTP pyrophosphatase MutT (NUDIX family)
MAVHADVSWESIQRCIEDRTCDFDNRKATAVVVVCLLEGESGLDVLFEVRSAQLKRQPGEVCLPGGKIDLGEDARDAAVRELSEELLVDASQVELLGWLGETEGPGGFKVSVFVAALHDYQETFNAREVDRVFTKPLSWFLENEPDVYVSRLEPHMPDEFPWDLVPGGRAYPFRGPEQDVCFYRTTKPLIWGFTAHIMRAFAHTLRL